MTHQPQQPLDELQALCARLRLKGEQASEIGRMLAQSKSLRQDGHNPPRDDLYMWPTPEQTTEWKAADTLECQAQEIQRLRDALEAVESEIMLDGQLAEIVQAALSSQENSDDR